MLETEDIDDDYFTPASSTSLANIFGKPGKENEADNETLKYTPPKPSKQEEVKATQCIFACALLGYEWSNGAYVAKGKLGFAIIKIIKTGVHNLVLYDGHKRTLSCATISTSFEVTVKENVYFSYHDDLHKYWSLNATDIETRKVIDVLKSLNVLIKYSSEEIKGPPEITSCETASSKNEQKVNEEKESDTDSSVNRRTKISILNRMASMGQSVLPPRTVTTEKTSDSSDTNDTNHYKVVRHKPAKSSMKRNSSDKNLVEYQSLIEAGKMGSSAVEHTNSSVPLFTYLNGQLVPVTNTTVSPSSGNDMNYFISEQRVSNSEIRININRMTDKADQILGKLVDLEQQDKETKNNFQIDILQKLLREYENKIKIYDNFIKAEGLNKQFGPQLIGLVSDESSNNPQGGGEDKTQELEKLSKEKDIKIAHLEAKIEMLQNKLEKEISKEKKSQEDLHIEIKNLKQDLDFKNKELSNISNDKGASVKDENESIGSKIKNVMNDAFRAVSANFENDIQYSGERVKAVTAAVIKKVTIESLNNL